ncbi:hypothetical protein FV219_00405 [Methylobacterium sp. WL122]|nr:hypothetical protein FV219_00405 [Methylobacterium sp. WL122]
MAPMRIAALLIRYLAASIAAFVAGPLIAAAFICLIVILFFGIFLIIPVVAIYFFGLIIAGIYLAYSLAFIPNIILSFAVLPLLHILLAPVPLLRDLTLPFIGAAAAIGLISINGGQGTIILCAGLGGMVAGYVFCLPLRGIESS